MLKADFWRTIPTVWKNLRSAIFGVKSPALVIHDPDAEQPHDLDDPFFDRTIQQRIGETIAKSAEKR